MVKEDKTATLAESITHQIMQIQIAERSIRDALQMGSNLLAQQYHRLKIEYIRQLNEMLEKANLRLIADEQKPLI